MPSHVDMLDALLKHQSGSITDAELEAACPGLLAMVTGTGNGTKPGRWNVPVDSVMVDAMQSKRLFGDLDPIVDRFLYRRNITMIAANNNVGKTLLAIQAGAQISQADEGVSVLDHHQMPLKRKGKVLLCVGEGGSGIQQRIEAAAKEMDLDWEQDRFMVMAGVPVFSEESNGRRPTVSDWQEFLRFMEDKVKATGYEPDVIIIDHLSRASVGANENAADEMTPVLANMRTLAEKLNCAILLLHHTNKGEGDARGSSAIGAEIDVAFLLELNEQVPPDVVEDLGDADDRIHKNTRFIKFRCTKQRDAEFPHPMDAAIISVDLDELDDTGKPVTGGFIAWYAPGQFNRLHKQNMMDDARRWFENHPQEEGTGRYFYKLPADDKPINGRSSVVYDVLAKLANEGFLTATAQGNRTLYKYNPNHAQSII